MHDRLKIGTAFGREYVLVSRDAMHSLDAATSSVVPKELAQYIGGKTGCPGYSNHNDGHAIDIETKVLSAKGKSVRLGAENRKLCLEIRPWMFEWMSGHCVEHGFAPYEPEPWHWNYVGALEGAVPGAGEDSRC